MSVTTSYPIESEQRNSFEEHPNLQKMLPPAYDYYFESYEECEPLEGEERFTASFRIGQGAATKDHVREWINAFCCHSLSTYRIDRTYPGATTWYMYRVDLRCHRNTKPKSHKRVKTPHKKHTDCPAKMIVKIRQPKLSRRKRLKTHLKNYPVEVILFHHHNHLTLENSSLKYRDPDVEVVEKFIRMYKAGYKPSAALEIHKRDLHLEHEHNFTSAIEDRGLCPDINWCYRQFDLLSKVNSRETISDLQIQSLYQYISQYNTKCGSVCVAIKSFSDSSGNIVVALLSPLMRSVHIKLACSANIMLIESLTVDYLRCKVYVMTTHNGSCKLPLGVLITTSDSALDLQRALNLYVELVPSQGFSGRGEAGPRLILIEDNDIQWTAVKETFPNSTLFLSPYFVIQKAWTLLCDDEVNCGHSCRLEAFEMLKNAVCAESVVDFENHFEKIKLIGKKLASLKFNEYLEDLFIRKQKWAACFMIGTKNLPIKSLELIKDCLTTIEDHFISTNKSCTMIELLEFLVSDMEQFYKEKLNRLFAGQFDDILSLLYNKNKSVCDGLEIVPYFKVKNVSSGQYYDVDMNSGLCSCAIGKTGRTCQHRHAVVRDINFGPTFQRQFRSCSKEELKGLIESFENRQENIDSFKNICAGGKTKFVKCLVKGKYEEQKQGAFDDVGKIRTRSHKIGYIFNSGNGGSSQDRIEQNRKPSAVKTLMCDDSCGVSMDSKDSANSPFKHYYPCHICGKVMLSSVLLTRHQKLHSHNKPFACDICGLGYLSRECLKNHYSRNHCLKKRFECKMCGKKFQKLGTFARHRKKHQINLFECSFCSELFSIDKDLKKHLNEVHKGDPPSIVLEEVKSQVLSTLHIPRQDIIEIVITETRGQLHTQTIGEIITSVK